MVENGLKMKQGVTDQKIVFPRHTTLTVVLRYSCEHPFLHEKGPEQRLRVLDTTNRRQIWLRVFFMMRQKPENYVTHQPAINRYTNNAAFRVQNHFVNDFVEG